MIVKLTYWLFFVTAFMFADLAEAQFEQPFLWHTSSSGNTLKISVDIPANHYLYADDRTKITVKSPGSDLKPFSNPESVFHQDDFGSGNIFPAGINVWKYKILPDTLYQIDIDFQGCKENSEDSPGVCFIPSETNFSFKLSPNANSEFKLEVDSSADKENSILEPELEALLGKFDLVKSKGGYLNKQKFLDFLNNHKNNKGEKDLDGNGIWLMFVFVIFGGLMLNLTPCVLPMIPINLAIIGAGKSAKSKKDGFVRGGVYGIGIAFAYGLLGVITVVSGATFGSLNSTYWFNFLVAFIFVILALAMFDILNIDFSKFSNKIGIKDTVKGGMLPIFIMGIVAALLAGACVAPVVIAVLLYSTTMYADGNSSGLFLPFLLGFGMALPWPLAGAGISALPHPGKWMIKIKQIMGVLILIFAGYYIYLGVGLLPSGNDNHSSSFVELENGLKQAMIEKKPVFIDFWASWCKNCKEMDRTTFKDPEVIKALESYVFIKFQAEDPTQKKIKKLLDRFQVVGLPGYVILEFKKDE